MKGIDELTKEEMRQSMMGKEIKEEIKAGIYKKSKKIPVGKHHGTVSRFLRGGQFSPQDERSDKRYTERNMRMGYGWSDETIRKREGWTKEQVKGYPDIITEVFSEGHAVLTRAWNICILCHKNIEAGSIVLGVVERVIGGSDREYICSSCVRKEAMKKPRVRRVIQTEKDLDEAFGK